MRTATRRRSVLFTIGTARRGGAEGQLVQVAAGLARRGHAVDVIFLADGGELTDVLDAAGVRWRVARLPIRRISRIGRDLLMVLRLAIYLLLWRPMVVMAWLPGAIWPTLLLTRALSRARRIAALRGETLSTSAPVRRLLTSAMRNAHVVTVNAPALTKEATALGTPGERVTFIPNGVVRPATPAADVRRQPPTAVVVANYRWYKGHDVLVRALAMVGTELRVRLLGEGAGLSEVKELAQDLKIEDELAFVPYPPDVAAELHAAQFAIHPSRTEGLSNAILEELAAGLPVVATEVGGTPILIDDGVHGLLVPPGDATALASAIEKLASDPGMRERMGSAARERAGAFSWQKSLDAYEALLFDASPRRSDR